MPIGYTLNALNEKLNQIRRYRVGFLDFLGFAISAFVFSSLIFFERPSDFLAHISAAEELGFSNGFFTYSVFYPIQHLLSLGGYSDLLQKLSLVGICTISYGWRYLATKSYLLAPKSTTFVATILSLGLLVAMPTVDPRGLFLFDNFFDLSRFSRVLIGQTPPSVWHNSTTILLSPLAFVSAVYVLKTWADGSRRHILLASGSLLLATWAKPNFSIAFIPAALILVVVSRPCASGSRRNRVLHTLVVVLPALILLVFQYLLTFVNPVDDMEKVSYVIKPFAQWEQFTDHMLVSVLRSIFFPLVVLLVVFAKRRKVSLPLLLGWFTYGIAMSIFILFHEIYPDGSPRFHGNFGWGAIPATYLLFAVSLKEWLEVRRTGPRLKRQSMFLDFFIFGSFLVHVLVGVVYLIAISAGWMAYG